MQIDFMQKEAAEEKILKELKINIAIIPKSKEKHENTEKSEVKKIECEIIEKKETLKKNQNLKAIKCKNPNDIMWAANSKIIDMIIQPFTIEANLIDEQTATALAKNEVYTAILFNEFLKTQKQQRQLLIKNAMQTIKAIEKTKAKTLIFSGAENPYELRSPKDLGSLLVTLGMKKENAIKSVKENPKKLLERLE